MLEDYDVTSCYDVMNTLDTFVLDRRSSVLSIVGQEGITLVNVTSHNMDCSDRFHISLYQENSVSEECGPLPHAHIHCEMLDHIKIKENYTQCLFECDCKTNDCKNKDIIFLRVSHPLEGGLCDITMTPL